jgi:hypothetical protein
MPPDPGVRRPVVPVTQPALAARLLRVRLVEALEDHVLERSLPLAATAPLRLF